jgi:hypothetical protein
VLVSRHTYTWPLYEVRRLVIDRSRWHYCLKPWIGQCRQTTIQDYTQTFMHDDGKLRFISNSWCRTDYATPDWAGTHHYTKSMSARQIYTRPCTRDIEFVQCPHPCGAKWAKHPEEKWKTAGWCPKCKSWSTWDVDMEWQLIEYPDARCDNSIVLA